MRPCLPLPLGMHAPDGLFSPAVNLVCLLVVVGLLLLAFRGLARRQDHRLVPLMGIMAAFVFAGQMVNFPISAGTTGHLLGGTLAAILLGPLAGLIVMTAVVFFQALLGDGGVTTLGPNIFNMGVVGTCIAYFVYRAFVGRATHDPARLVGGAAFAAWTAVVLASVFASLELAASGTTSLARTLPAMVGVHMLIGVGEALITAAVIAFVWKVRPELLQAERAGAAPVRSAGVAFGLAVSLAIALFLSLLPSLWDHPDGLEYVGFQQGLIVEEEVRDDDTGALLALPAYPLGVRLESVDGRPVVAHAYGESPFQTGDVLTTLAGRPTPSLAAASAILEEAEAGGTAQRKQVAVSVERDGKGRVMALSPAAGPTGGARPPLVALLPDYTVPGVSGLWSTSLAGAIGTLVMFFVAMVLGRVLIRPGALARAAADAGVATSGSAERAD